MGGVNRACAFVGLMWFQEEVMQYYGCCLPEQISTTSRFGVSCRRIRIGRAAEKHSTVVGSVTTPGNTTGLMNVRRGSVLF
jgi:hypothetical protein